MRWIIALTFLAHFALAAETPAASPLGTVQDYFKALAAGEQDVGRFIDFEGLAQDCISSTWKKLTAKQKTEYIKSFTELVETQHLRKSREIKDASAIECKEGKAGATEAKVKCTIPRPDLPSEAEYLLKKSGDQWRIRNMIIDQVNVRKNYETMFARDLQYFTFDEMLDKMRLGLAPAAK